MKPLTTTLSTATILATLILPTTQANNKINMNDLHQQHFNRLTLSQKIADAKFALSNFLQNLSSNNSNNCKAELLQIVSTGINENPVEIKNKKIVRKCLNEIPLTKIPQHVKSIIFQKILKTPKIDKTNNCTFKNPSGCTITNINIPPPSCIPQNNGSKQQVQHVKNIENNNQQLEPMFCPS